MGEGKRFVLRSDISAAELGSVGAVLCGFRVGDVDLVEPLPAGKTPPLSSGLTLTPWPNRVSGGRWLLNGEPQQLAITDVKHNAASHGLLRFTEYQLKERTENTLTFTAAISAQAGWPFVLDTWVRYVISANELQVFHGVQNLSEHIAPYATGSHPYLRLGKHDIADLILQIPAEEYLETDELLAPRAWHPVSYGTDLREGKRVGDLLLDTTFRQLRPDIGVVATLKAPDGSFLELLQDPSWRYLQVFTTPIFPRTDGVGLAVAIEPMSAPPNALNTGEGLVWLNPGEKRETSWGLRYRPAA